MEYRSSHCLCLKLFTFVLFWCCLASLSLASIHSHRHSRHDELDKHPLSKINIYKTTLAFRNSVSIKASPLVLGFKVNNTVFILAKNYQISRKQWSLILYEGWALYMSPTMKPVLHIREGNNIPEIYKYYPTLAISFKWKSDAYMYQKKCDNSRSYFSILSYLYTFFYGI